MEELAGCLGRFSTLGDGGGVRHPRRICPLLWQFLQRLTKACAAVSEVCIHISEIDLYPAQREQVTGEASGPPLDDHSGRRQSPVHFP